MKFRRLALALASIASLFMMAAPARALTYFEWNAGDLPGSAEAVPAGTTVISGGLFANPFGPYDFDLVDLFKIQIDDPLAFFVTTGPGTNAFLIADPVLYLFDLNGVAVSMNDDANGSQSALAGLPGGFGAGMYFLAVAFAGVEPTGGGNSLFDVFGSGDVIDQTSVDAWQGGPLSPNFDITGQYRLRFFAVPEPGSLLLMLLGLAAASTLRASRRALVA